MKKIFFSLVLMLLLTSCAFSIQIQRSAKSKTISNKMFSVVIPGNYRGSYIIRKRKDTISIYDKASKKAGFGGFAFAIRAFKNPSDHALLPGGVKIGELVNKKGKIYDMVLKYPTDVQYDYTKDEPQAYKNLYDLGKNVTVKGKGRYRYLKNQGMKGKYLYKEVLKKHITAIEEKWDSNRLEKENMSYMYNVLSKTGGNVLDKVGYVYCDVNADGIEELLIGEITQGVFKGAIYDIYTMKDRRPIHVVSGGTRDRYYTNGYFIINEYLSGAQENGWNIYTLVENSNELFFQVGFKYDAYENRNNPWFISYNLNENAWDNISKVVFEERKSRFGNYKRFDFIPLSSLYK